MPFMKTILLSMLAQSCLLFGQTNPSQAQNTSHPGIEYPEGSHPQGKMIGQRSDPQFPHAQRPESDSVLTLLGRWPWGPCYTTGIRGNYGFIGNGALVQTLDLSDPSSPRILGEYLTGQIVLDISLRDSLAFVCTGESLIILNTASPNNVVKLGGIRLLGVARVRVADSLAFVTVGDVLAAIDISDIQAPFLRGFTLAAGTPQAFAVSGRYVYLGDLGRLPGAMLIFDATNPDSIELVDSFFSLGFPYAAEIRDTVLLISGGGIGEPDAVEFYSIANPTAPAFLSTVPGIEGRGASIRDTIAYVSANDGLRSICIARPSQPSVLGTLAINGGRLASAGSLIVVSGDSRAYVVNVPRSDSLNIASAFPTGGWAEKIFLKDSLAFVASAQAGLWILNIADPSSPRCIANVNVGGFAVDVVVDANCAYLINYPGDLWIIDVSDPKSPTIASHSNTTSRGGPSAIAKSGNLVFISQLLSAGQDTIVRMMDVSNPMLPTPVGAIVRNLRAYDVAARDSILFVASPDSGLQIFDAHYPQNPQTLGKLDVSIASVALSDSIATVSFGQLYLVSIANLSSPYVLGSILAGYGVTYPDVTISGNFVYWTNGDGAVFDIGNPEMPRQAARFRGNDVGRGIAAHDDLIFYADQTGGVWIWRNNLITSVPLPEDRVQPNDYRLFQNYPNPFNNQTIIQFSVPKREQVRVDLFNVLGQKIVTLFDETAEAGAHTLRLDASRQIGLASGIYFYRMQTQSATLTKPMVYLK